MSSSQPTENNGNGLSFVNGKENVVFQGGNIPLNQMYGQVQVSPGPDMLTSSYAGHGTNGSLNISNPRYSAMYRNTLLRYSPTDTLPPPTPVYPGHGQVSPMSVRSGTVATVSPYHTIRSHMHQHQHQQYIQVRLGNFS